MEIKAIRYVTSAATLAQMPSDGLPEVALVGRSNVGKSSLLNMLAQRRSLARVSGTPGKTRMFNFYCANGQYYFVDAPGYGYAKVSKVERNAWARAIDEYLCRRASLCLVLQLIDIRHPPSRLDESMMHLLSGCTVPRLIVLTKADKVSKNARVQAARDIAKILQTMGTEAPMIASSAHKIIGRCELLDWIGHILTLNTHNIAGSAIDP